MLRISGSDYKINTSTAVAIGCFDGLHIGHKAVIDAAVDFARENSLKSVVFQIVADAQCAPLQSRGKFVELLHSWDVDFLVSQQLDEEFKNISCEEFVEEYLRDRLRAKYVSVGYNFRFGKGAAGDAALLRALCANFDIEVNIMPPICVGGEAVSSTKIRELINIGADISKYLNR